MFSVHDDHPIFLVINISTHSTERVPVSARMVFLVEQEEESMKDKLICFVLA